MKIRRNDKVKVIVGKDAGKQGKVLSVLKDRGKIVVENVNVVKRHVKPGAVSKEGGIVKIEKPINVSNVMIVCERCGKPVRTGVSMVGEKKYRVCKRCGEVIGK
jgi:large subunit ribosomal protein L24